MKPRNKSSFATICLHIAALCFCILPPAICTLFYFPLWRGSSAKTLAGGTMLLLLLSAMPLLKLIRHRLRSVAGYVGWLVLFILFLTLSSIAHEMTVISFYGFIGNLIGAVLFKISDRRRGE